MRNVLADESNLYPNIPLFNDYEINRVQGWFSQFNVVMRSVLDKMEHYGIRDVHVALQWIKSYFSCRQLYAFESIKLASQLMMQSIQCGVYQGSILGPFCLYIDTKDLRKTSKLTELLLFAYDDTSIFFSHSKLNYLENVPNNKLHNVNICLRCNKLSINIKKQI